MKQVNLAAVERIIAETAQAEIMPRFRRLLTGDVQMKGVNDPVTVADKSAEIALTARLTSYLPGSVVVGEESFAIDPTIVSHFGREHDVWVIDPIDGTRNFIEGKTEFGTMVALVRQRKTIAAWIHDPNTGDTLAAEQGSGVWLRGQKMRLAGHDATINSVSIIGSRLRKLLLTPEFAPQAAGMPEFETGSACAYDYGRLFSGSSVFAGSAAARAAYLLYRQSKPWDHLPGLFMLQEAGGYAADLQGRPYDMEATKAGLLVAPNREAWQEIHAVFKPAIEMLINHQM